MKALMERNWEIINLTGRMQCARCWEVKDVQDFNPRSDKRGKDGLERWTAYCASCRAAETRQWSRDNPERALRNKRRSIWRTYGVTEEQYHTMLSEQGGVCAICHQENPDKHPRNGKQFGLSVDHDHDTGAIRGLLCNRCNRALGLLNDDVELLRTAIGYIEGGP